MDEVKEDKISSTVLAVFAFVSFLSANLAIYQAQASGIMAFLPIPEEYKPVFTLIGAGVIGYAAYWNFKTSSKREEAAYQTGLYEEVPQETITPEEATNDGDTA